MTQSIPETTENSNKLEIDLLLKDYENRYKEMQLHMKRYHTQTNILSILGTIITIITLVVSKTNFVNSDNSLGLFKATMTTSEINTYFLLAILLLGLFVIYYFYILAQDALCMMYVNMYRIGAIEDALNKIAGKAILAWDNMILIDYHSHKKWHIGKWIKPSYSLPVWGLLVMLILNSLLVLLSYALPTPIFIFYLLLSIVLFTYNIYQSALINTIGRPEMKNIVNRAKY